MAPRAASINRDYRPVHKHRRALPGTRPVCHESELATSTAMNNETQAQGWVAEAKRQASGRE